MDFWSSLSIDSLGIVGVSTGEIFIVHTICVLARPLDFKPPITITTVCTMHCILHHIRSIVTHHPPQSHLFQANYTVDTAGWYRHWVAPCWPAASTSLLLRCTAEEKNDELESWQQYLKKDLITCASTPCSYHSASRTFQWMPKGLCRKQKILVSRLLQISLPPWQHKKLIGIG